MTNSIRKSKLPTVEKCHINIHNSKLKPNLKIFANKRYETFKIGNNKLISDTVTESEFNNMIEGKDLVIHYVIGSRREINQATSILLLLTDYLKTLNTNSVTIELQIAAHRVYNHTDKEEQAEKVLLQAEAKSDMLPLQLTLELEGINFLSLTFDTSTCVPSKVYEKAEYIVELDVTENAVHYVIDQILSYTRKTNLLATV